MKSKVSKEFTRKPAEFFKNSSCDFLENERSHTVVERGFVDAVNNGEEKIISKNVQKELTTQKPNDSFKNTSNIFLENERYHTVAESKVIDKNITTYDSEKQQNGTQIEEFAEKTKTSETQQRFVFSAGSLKRYVTTCYFQTKHVPVSYSETMVVNIGSSKKRFYEMVYHENKLVPYKWSEHLSMTIKGEEIAPLQKSEINIPLEKPMYHYISLEPQQEMVENISVA